MASVGLDIFLAAIAFGASQVAVVATRSDDPEYVQALREQMAIGEAITNIAAADIALERVKLSANWMAACGQPGEDARLFEAVQAASEACRALGISHRVHFISASLAKAFAGRAGFLTMPAAMRNYVLSTSYPNMFSSCLLPHEVAALDATLVVIVPADRERERLQAVSRRVRAELLALGYPVGHGSEQIIALEAGTEPDTLVLRDHLESRGVFGAVFCAPATARNRAMVRLTLHAALTEAEIGHLLAVAREIAPLVKPWDWPIARRGRGAATAEPALVQTS